MPPHLRGDVVERIVGRVARCGQLDTLKHQLAHFVQSVRVEEGGSSFEIRASSGVAKPNMTSLCFSTRSREGVEATDALGCPRRFNPSLSDLVPS